MLKVLSILIVFVAILVGYLYNDAPWIFGQRTGDTEKYLITKHLPFLDDELLGLAETIGPDFGMYRKHCLRVMIFTQYLIDKDEWKKQKNLMELASVAVAYHDVGLWVDGGKLDYLDPSIDKLEKNLKGKYTEPELNIMKEIIYQHHRVTEYESGLGSGADAVINAVRKADLADFSYGVIRSGIPPGLIEAAYDKLPPTGFHKMLAGKPPKLSPGDLMGMLDILKIFKW